MKINSLIRASKRDASRALHLKKMCDLDRKSSLFLRGLLNDWVDTMKSGGATLVNKEVLQSPMTEDQIAAYFRRKASPASETVAEVEREYFAMRNQEISEKRRLYSPN